MTAAETLWLPVMALDHEMRWEPKANPQDWAHVDARGTAWLMGKPLNSAHHPPLTVQMMRARFVAEQTMTVFSPDTCQIQTNVTVPKGAELLLIAYTRHGRRSALTYQELAARLAEHPVLPRCAVVAIYALDPTPVSFAYCDGALTELERAV